MKLLIPSEGPKLKDKFSERFARAPFLIFYDTETKEINSEQNQFKDMQSGVGVKISQHIANKDVDVAIAHHFGPKALDALKSFGIKTFIVEDITNKTAQDIVEDFNSNRLKEVN